MNNICPLIEGDHHWYEEEADRNIQLKREIQNSGDWVELYTFAQGLCLNSDLPGCSSRLNTIHNSILACTDPCNRDTYKGQLAQLIIDAGYTGGGPQADQGLRGDPFTRADTSQAPVSYLQLTTNGEHNIHDAVRGYMNEETRPEIVATYGPIEDWDTSQRTDMRYLFTNFNYKLTLSFIQ